MEKYGNFYTWELHKYISSGLYTRDSGVYLVVFRVLIPGSNVLIYSYIYYPDIFVNSVLYYLLRKNNFKNSLIYKEWGDFLSVLDSSLGEGNSIQEVKDENALYGNNYIKDFYLNESSLIWYNYNELFDLVKKMTIVSDEGLDRISLLIDFAVKKDYFNFFVQAISLDEMYKADAKVVGNDIYLLKDCMFVVKNLDELMTKLNKIGYEVNRGPKSQRDKLNTMSSFLTTVDIDFRNYLFTQQLNSIRSRVIPSYFQLPKSKFSFENIHMNIGSVRYYSSKRYISSKVISNRQDLFEQNYSIISDILEKNFNVGSYAVQEEIEKCLYNQENLIATLDNGKDMFRLNFNEASYNFLKTKQEELCSLLNLPDELVVNTKIYSGKYIPLLKQIISVLGSNTVANLLLSYFMEVLTKETHNLEGEDNDVQTPGIMSTIAFNNFGKKIFNKYIYHMYIKSEIYKKQRENNNYSLNEYIQSIKSEYEDIYTEDGSYAMLGGYFVWNLVTVNLLYQVLAKHPLNDLETINFLRITQNVRELLVNDKVRIYHLPQKLPMVCEPKDWVYSLDNSKNKLGGYLLNDVYYIEKLISDRIGYAIQTTLKEGNLVIPMVSGVMKTPYKINVDTLEFVSKYGIKKKILIDDSSKDIRNFINNPYKKYIQKKVAKKYRSIISKILVEKNILSIASVYSSVEKIYFPVRLDFRLRVYCNTEYFDYQKSELAKGLISFANPGYISKTDKDAIKYYKAYGANMFGNGLDKKSLNYRVKWIDDNTDKILNFEFNDMVDNAENKTCFISFCFEYIQFVKFMNSIDELIFSTYLPIQLDASCNGYQHLALLTKETKLLSKLNLDSSTHDDIPGDFYSYISDLGSEYIKDTIDKLPDTIDKLTDSIDKLTDTIDKLTDLDSKKEKEKEKKDFIYKKENAISRLNSLNKIVEIKFGRDIYKLVIMRDSYSAGTDTIAATILSNEYMVEYETGKNTYYMYKDYKVKLTKKDIMIFVVALKRVISRIAPKINNLSQYLTKVVYICTALGMYIPWNLPNGAEIKSSYLIEKEHKIPAFAFTKSKYTFKKYLSDQYDGGKQKKAIRPNLIHSLDACVISELYANLKSDNIALYTVHDCFAVTANNVPKLINKLIMVYIKMYSSNDYLTTFDSVLKFDLNKTFGDKIYKLNDDYINIPNKNKIKTEPFPNIKEITKLDEKKLKKKGFPDISIITKLNKNINIEEQLKQSSYPAV